MQMENSVNNSNNYYSDEIINWEAEAAAVIKDVQDHVKEIFVSENLRSNNFEIFINLKTLEDGKYCIRVSGSGFQIAGKDFDRTNELTDNPEDYYETPYALLTCISRGYVQSFANRLSQQMRDTLA